MKNRIFSIAIAVITAASLSACGKTAPSTAAAATDTAADTAASDTASPSEASSEPETADASDRLSIVVTNFPEYDFARQIAGDKADVTMLLKPGAESHTYDPTPEDIITIQNSDMFVYVGGDSDEWVDDVLASMDQSNMNVFRLMDAVDTVEEELVEGMEEEEEEDEGEGEEPELDEHVWTSPANAMTIVRKMADTIETLDPENKDAYEENTNGYIAQISDLDKAFHEVIDNAARREIIVGDRFPFRYFCDEYGLTYYAAFPGCSTDTQASAKTVAFLIDKVKNDQIPVVFHIELSNEEMCSSIAEATGAKSELLNAVHNVSDEDFKAGVTYVSLMQHNVEVLKEALN
ncbi:zinc transport system substrate-binding protein [Lachnospiraceae bacterium]|nr:zinc transport system substrate-binding protein [Lachnospiraceae bacterium]